ncbi:secretoglobin family 2B member 20-like [Grammomys surdaster]|uniref:secretoglobin family 2B member 20-like n=1 Tax=Grammomys surdaster TaxID=491861 RepID=UPI0010A02CEE|nr:secretoglobin family 2B member 20-like [Grammomys surdaster]
MKGTLLLLAFLVIGELGFQTTEACVPFFKTYAAVLAPSRALLHTQISKFNAIAEERVAYEKIQDCFGKGRITNTLLNPKILESMLASKECVRYYADDTLSKVKDVLGTLSQL